MSYMHLVVIATLSFGVATGAKAEDVSYQTHEQLRNSAKEFLDSRLSITPAGKDSKVTIGHLDSRLRLTACQEPLAPFLSAGSRLQGKLTVGLSCSKPKPWTVYIPATIRTYANVMAAAHVLGKGTIVTNADIISVRQEITDLRSGYFTSPDNIIGKAVKRMINPGQVFAPNRLKAPLLVRRGDKVTIVAASSGIQVRVKGEALKDAAYGEKLPVRNSRSKRIIQAIATESGTVKVAM